MAVTASQLIASVNVTGAAASAAALLTVGAASDSAGAKLRTLAIGGTILATAALVAAGAKAVEMAANFQQGVNRLRTGAGDAQDSFNTLASGILKVSLATGVMTGPLVQAMYLILSSGQRGAQAFDTLAAAAKGAQIEQASVVDVANTLSGVMTNYGTKVFGASAYMNGLIKAVSLGKITLQDLAVAMGPIDPIANHLGVSFSDLAAAMTTQTNAMIPARIAATGLRFLMQQLENPTKKARDEMAAMGLDSVKVANEMKVSLPGALEMIYNAAKKAGPEGSVPFNRAIADMVGGIRATTAFMGLTGPHFAAFARNAQMIAAAMRSGQGEVNGWALAQSNFNVVMDKAKAALEAVFIQVGLALLPALGHLVTQLTPLITQFGQWLLSSGALQTVLNVLVAGVVGLFKAIGVLASILGTIIGFFQRNQWAVDMLAAVLATIAIQILSVIVPAFIAWAVAAGAAAVATIAAMWPGLLLLAAIALAIFGVIELVQHWGAVMNWFGSVFSAIGTFVHGVITQIVAWFQDGNSAVGRTFRVLAAIVLLPFAPLIATIAAVILVIRNWGAIVQWIGQRFSDLGATVHGALTGLKNDVGGIFSAIGTTIHHAILGAYQGVVDAGHWLYQHNTYVKAATDLVAADFHVLGTVTHTVFTDIKNFVGAAFDWLGTHLRDVAASIKNTVGSLFDALGSHLRGVATGTKNFVGNAFDALGSAVRGAMTWLKNAVGGLFDQMGTWVRTSVTALKNFVGNAFSQLGSDIHNIVSGIGSWLAGFFGNLAGQAFQWGANLLQGFINGIGSMMSQLGGAVHNVISSVAGLLGFHSPTKEGPGRDADKWMPNLMRMLTAGIVQGTPGFQAALSQLFKPISMQVGASLAGGGTLSGVAPRYLFPLPASGSTPVVVNVNVVPEVKLDGVRLSRALMPHQANALRYNVTGLIGR